MTERADTEEAAKSDGKCCVPVSDAVKAWFYNGLVSLFWTMWNYTEVAIALVEWQRLYYQLIWSNSFNKPFSKSLRRQIFLSHICSMPHTK